MTAGRVGALAAATLVAGLLVACEGGGSDDDAGLGASSAGGSSSDGGAGGTGLTVEAHDIAFDSDTYRIATGPVDVEYVQEGSLPHTLVIEATDGGSVDGFELAVGDAGSDSGSVDLPPGDYTIYCDVPGHREAGMEAELRVE